MKRLFAGTALALLLTLSAGHAATMRPEVGKPLIKAKQLYQAHSYAAALAQLRQAAAAPGLTSAEEFVIEEMRGPVAQAAGDKATAERAYAYLLASGKLSGPDEIRILQAEATLNLESKNYPAAITWLNKYFKAGGENADMRTQLIYAYFQNNDYANAAKLQAAQIAAEQKARHAPSEQQLQMLAAAYRSAGDTVGFKNAMQNLVYYYPKPDYWANLTAPIEASHSFASSRLTLDLMRFKAAIGALTKPDDYFDMAEYALNGQLPGEAKAIVDKAYASNLFGTGPQASRQKRLADLVARTYASELPLLPKKEADAKTQHDGNPLVTVGEEYCSYGQYDKGIPLIEAGIAKGELRHPNDTLLHLGLAYLGAGNKAKALQVLKTVGGNDGAADIAALWGLYLSRTK